MINVAVKAMYMGMWHLKTDTRVYINLLETDLSGA